MTDHHSPAESGQGLLGAKVSIDVSTDDRDAGNRVFGRVVDTQPEDYDGTRPIGVRLLCEYESDNFGMHAKVRSQPESAWQPIETAPVTPWSEELPSYYSFRCLVVDNEWVREASASYTYQKHRLVWKDGHGRSLQPKLWQPLPMAPGRPA